MKSATKSQRPHLEKMSADTGLTVLQIVVSLLAFVIMADIKKQFAESDG